MTLPSAPCACAWLLLCLILTFLEWGALFPHAFCATNEPDRHRVGASGLAIPRVFPIGIDSTRVPHRSNIKDDVQHSLAEDAYVYVFHIADDSQACNVLINVDRLQKDFQTRHRIILIAASPVSVRTLELFIGRNVTVSTPQTSTTFTKLSRRQQDNVLKLHAIRLQDSHPTLKRVLLLGSEQLLLQDLDPLFEVIPPFEVAALASADARKLDTGIMMATFSERLLDLAALGLEGFASTSAPGGTDMLNHLFARDALILPGSLETSSKHWLQWTLPEWFEQSDTVSEHVATAAHAAVDAAVAATEGKGKTMVELRSLGSRRREKRFHETDARPEKQEQPVQIEETSTQDSQSVAQRTPPSQRVLYPELWDLYEVSPVVHFDDEEYKPWNLEVEDVDHLRADAHPVFLQLASDWLEAANRLCPTDTR